MKKLMMLFLIGMLPFTFLNAEDAAESKEKTLTMEDFETQVEACKEAMDKENKLSRKTAILSSIRSLTYNIENQRYRYVANDCASFSNNSYPVPVRKEIDKLVKICRIMIRQGKAKLVKDGNALYQQVIDITEKDVSLDELEKLKDKIEIRRDSMNSNSNTGEGLRNTYKKLEIANRFLNYWMAYKSAVEEEDYNKAGSQLDSLLSNTTYYSVLSAKVLRLKKAELKKISVNRFDTEVKELRKELLAADDSEKVKAVLTKFQVLSNNYSSILRNTTQQNELSYTKSALDYWLSVIVCEESGDYKKAINSMRSFDSGYYRNTLLLKWKEIQSKKKALVEKLLSSPRTFDPVIESIDEHLKKCKDLESLIAFQSKIQDLRNNFSSSHNQELYALQQDVQNLIKMYKSLKSNNYTYVFQMFNYQNQSHPWREFMQKQKESIRLQAVAAFADIDVKKLQNKEKSPDKVLLEFADKAAENKEWGNVYLLLNTYAMAFCYNTQQPVWLREEIAGCRAFMTGRNFEKAGMISKAVSNYAIVLQQKESHRIPTEETIKRINNIRENNPQLFDPNTGSLKTPKPKPVLNPVPTPINLQPGYRLQEELDISPKPGIRHKK